MDLLKLNPNLQFIPKNQNQNQNKIPKTQFKCLTVKQLRLRVRSELNGKFNGALSGEVDPRFIDRQKALEAAMHDINSSFGKGSVTRLGSAGGALVETFPSGCLTLDFALGGGLPKGRIVEIYGPESSGKTTLALHAIAEIQKIGGNAMLVDAEHAFDAAYSKALGVDVENLIVCQPDNGEMALEIADRMCRSGAVDLICIDSVSALTPRAEIEGEIGMQQMGLQARLMSQALRKMSGNASKAGCTLIFLNQIRHKIGVYYGNPEVTSGGIALKFFASLRLEIRPIGKVKSVKGDEDIGLRVRVRVQKSKVSRPYKQAEFEIIFGEGVSKLGCMLDCAEIFDVVMKKGSWYSYKDQRLGQGRDRALQYLRENSQLSDEIEQIMASSNTLINVSYKSLLTTISRELGYPDPLYGTVQEAPFVACVVMPPKAGDLAYYKAGKVCESLLEAQENAAESLIHVLITKFDLIIDDISRQKQEQSELCYGLFLRKRRIIETHNRSSGANNTLNGGALQIVTEKNKSSRIVSIDFEELLAAVVNKLEIKITRLDCVCLGYEKYRSAIGFRCGKTPRDMEWVFSDEEPTEEIAKQALAKKAIIFLQPIYRFRVRDVNYDAMNKSCLFSFLQRESYLTTAERNFGLGKDNDEPAFLPLLDIHTPTTSGSKIPYPTEPPLRPKKRRTKNLRVRIPVPVQNFVIDSSDLNLVFKGKGKAT